MITHSIKAPSFLARVVHSFMGQKNSTPTVHYPTSNNSVWPKDRFSIFIENVKKNFKVDQYVCYNSDVEVAGKIPPSVYKIMSINELWYDCQVDLGVCQPKALFVTCTKFMGGTGFPIAPCRMRRLSDAEVALVNLQDSPTQGNA